MSKVVREHMLRSIFKPKERHMKTTLIALCAAMMIAPAVQAAEPAMSAPTAPADGVIRVKSLYSVDETVERLKADIAAKGIK